MTPYHSIILFLLLSCTLPAVAQPSLVQPDYDLITPFELDSNYSASYQETIDYYGVLAKAYPTRCIRIRLGATDSGTPLYAFKISDQSLFEEISAEHTFFINNAIHAGEPCGVDASMMLARDLLAKPNVLPKGYQIIIIPAYNVGGMLRRGRDTRANQDGPLLHGFRGNARNLDLNRDFMKQDSRNARMLCRIIAETSPDIFIDTHTTNGADYAYELTIIATQPEKLGPVLGPYMRDNLLPDLYSGMAKRGHLVSPYVYSNGVPQEAGIMPFIESGRYSSGYAALHHSLAFITEAHMLKPFATRVRSTQSFLQEALDFWIVNAPDIKRARDLNRTTMFAKEATDTRFEVDSTRADTLAFLGYTAVREVSAITGAERLRYDRSRPTTTPTVYHAYAKPAHSIPTPAGYIVPAAYRELLERPDLTAVTITQPYSRSNFDLNKIVRANITDYKTSTTAYEGHYLHYGVTVAYEADSLRIGEKALYVPLTPENAQLLVALFEPDAPDSYFVWGAFDSQLQQKEHFSGYVFEETASELLANDDNLRLEFNAKKASDTDFKADAQAQLDWLYERSPYYEVVRLNPIMRVNR